MKTAFFFLVVLLAYAPLSTFAQTYKCKNASGKITYSDQPCPDAPGPTIGPARTEPVDRVYQDAKSREESLRKAYARRDEEIRRYDRDCQAGKTSACIEYKNALKAVVAPGPSGMDEVRNDIVRSCQSGNAAACREVCQESSYGVRGSLYFYQSCGKVLYRPHGDYWWVSSQYKADSKPPDPEQVAGSSVNVQFIITCFRKKLSTTDVEASSFRAHEIVAVSKAGSGYEFTRTYARASELGHTNVGPVFYSMEQLADNACPR